MKTTLQCPSKLNHDVCLPKRDMHFKTLGPPFPSFDNSIVNRRNYGVKYSITLQPRNLAAPKNLRSTAALQFPLRESIHTSTIKSELTMEPKGSKYLSSITPKSSKEKNASKQLSPLPPNITKLPDLSKLNDVAQSRPLLKPRPKKVTYDSNGISEIARLFDQSHTSSGYVYETPKIAK